MLLTYLILSSSSSELELVKSQLVQATRIEGGARQEIGAELARFQDHFGRQFTVTRGSVDSFRASGPSQDQGYAVCRYDKQGVLDRVVMTYKAAARLNRFVSTNTVFAEGALTDDAFTSGVKNGAPYLSSTVNDYKSKKPYYSLLEAVMLFDYRPTPEPIHLLNLTHLGGDPAVRGFHFLPAQPEDVLASNWTSDRGGLMIAVQPGSHPRNIVSAGAIDGLGTIYLSVFPHLFHLNGAARMSDRDEGMVFDGTPVRRAGSIDLETVSDLRSLVPEDWLTPPTK